MSLFSNAWTGVKKAARTVGNYAADTGLAVVDHNLGFFGATDVISSGDYHTKLGKTADKVLKVVDPLMGKIAGAAVGGAIGGPAGAMVGMSVMGSVQSGVGAATNKMPKADAGLNPELFKVYGGDNTTQNSAMTSYYKNGGTNIKFLKKCADGTFGKSVGSLDTIDTMNNQTTQGGGIQKLAGDYGVAIGNSHAQGGIKMPGLDMEIEGGEGVLSNNDGTIDVITNKYGFAGVAHKLGAELGHVENQIKTNLKHVNELGMTYVGAGSRPTRNSIKRTIDNTMSDVGTLEQKRDGIKSQLKQLSVSQPNADANATIMADGAVNKKVDPKDNKSNLIAENAKNMSQFQQDVPRDASIKTRAELDYYKSKLDNALRQKNPEAFDKLVTSAPKSIKDRIAYADQLYKAGDYTHALSVDEIKHTLGTDYNRFEELRANNANTLGVNPTGSNETKPSAIDTAYGLRNSLIIPKATYSRAVMSQDSSGKRVQTGDLKAEVKYDPNSKDKFIYDYKDATKYADGIIDLAGIGANTSGAQSSYQPYQVIGSKSNMLTSGLGDSSKLKVSTGGINNTMGSIGNLATQYGGVAAAGLESITNSILAYKYSKLKTPKPTMYNPAMQNVNVDTSATETAIKSASVDANKAITENSSSSQMAISNINKVKGTTLDRLAQTNEYKTNAENQLRNQNVQTQNQTQVANIGARGNYDAAKFNQKVTSLTMASQISSNLANRLIEQSNNAKELDFQKMQVGIMGEASKMQTGTDYTLDATIGQQLSANPNMSYDELQKKYPNIDSNKLTRIYNNRPKR